jgi:mannosyltransferase
MQGPRLTPIVIGASLLAMMLFVLGISYFLLGAQSLRLDEAQSLWQTSHTPSKLLYLVGQDVHVPLYHFMLYFWQLLFGNGVATVRIMSLVLYLVTIPLTYKLGAEAVSRRVGLLAALMLTLSPFMNWYGNEARMYSLLTLVTVVNQIFFLRAWQRGRRSDWICYILSAMVGVYSHYFFLLVLLTQAIYFLLRPQVFPKGTFKRLSGAAILVIAALAPWLLYVVHLGLASGTKPLLSKPTTVDLFNTFSQFIFGFQDDHINTFIVSLWPLTVLLAFLTLQRHRRMSPSVFYLLFGAVFPVIFAFLFSFFIHPFYLSRYLIVALPSLYIFLSWVLSTYGRKLQFTVVTIFLVGMSITLYQEIASSSNPVKENYKSAVEYLNTHAKAQDIVVVSAPFTIYPVEYYYRAPAQLTTLPIWDRFVAANAPTYSPRRLPTEVATLTASHEHLYLLLSYNQGYEKDLKSYFENRYPTIYKHTFSTDLTLYEFQVSYKPLVTIGR